MKIKGSASVSVMRTRQASANPIGTLEYFSINFMTWLHVLGKREADEQGAAAKIIHRD